MEVFADRRVRERERRVGFDGVGQARTSFGYVGQITYKIDPKWRVHMDVYNLFDRKDSDVDYYYASRLQGEPVGGVNDVHFHPVEPRTVRVTLTGYF